MPVTVSEKFQSRDVVRGINPSAQLNYIIQGTDDYDEALSQLALQAPQVFDNWKYKFTTDILGSVWTA